MKEIQEGEGSTYQRWGRGRHWGGAKAMLAEWLLCDLYRAMCFTGCISYWLLCKKLPQMQWLKNKSLWWTSLCSHQQLPTSGPRHVVLSTTGQFASSRTAGGSLALSLSDFLAPLKEITWLGKAHPGDSSFWFVSSQLIRNFNYKFKIHSPCQTMQPNHGIDTPSYSQTLPTLKGREFYRVCTQGEGNLGGPFRVLPTTWDQGKWGWRTISKVRA